MWQCAANIRIIKYIGMYIHLPKYLFDFRTARITGHSFVGFLVFYIVNIKIYSNILMFRVGYIHSTNVCMRP